MSVIKQLPEDKYRRWDLWEALQDDPRREEPFFTSDRGKARKRLIWQDCDYTALPYRRLGAIKQGSIYCYGRREHFNGVFQESIQTRISEY